MIEGGGGGGGDVVGTTTICGAVCCSLPLRIFFLRLSSGLLIRLAEYGRDLPRIFAGGILIGF